MIGCLLVAVLIGHSNSGGANLVSNPGFVKPDTTGKAPLDYELTGSARWSWCGYADEVATHGVALNSYAEAGSVSQMVSGIDQKRGKWLRFKFRGRAEDGFSVSSDQVAMRIAFYADHGKRYIDSAARLIYREIEKDRKDFTVNGDNGKAGAVVWRTYEFEELLPFPEVDSLKVGVEFKGGNAKSGTSSVFWIEDFELTQSDWSSDGRVEPVAKTAAGVPPVSTAGMISLGGRWYYQPASGEQISLDSAGHLAQVLTVTEANAARLFYKDDRLENPFASNMTAWMRKGYMDQNGKVLAEDRFVPDNVTVIFNGSDKFSIRVHNIPNHPTAKFPDTYGTQGYNPSYIQEHVDTYDLPVNPSKNPKAVAMTDRDANGALNMGPVGLAVNGVPFFNPFDANMVDASNIMDRCCGHPSPDYRYHYHKYPICVNTPFVDRGEAHSPIIGFAADGFPVYGPYESKGEMARDSKSNPLDAFNAHYDPVRGWHYHATPGKFPYLIGGYMGKR